MLLASVIANRSPRYHCLEVATCMACTHDIYSHEGLTKDNADFPRRDAYSQNKKEAPSCIIATQGRGTQTLYRVCGESVGSVASLILTAFKLA